MLITGLEVMKMTSTTQTKISSKLYRDAAIEAQANNITVDEQVINRTLCQGHF